MGGSDARRAQLIVAGVEGGAIALPAPRQEAEAGSRRVLSAFRVLILRAGFPSAAPVGSWW